MAQPTTDKVTGGVVVIGGIFILAIVAGASRSVGKIAIAFMAGVLFIWLMTSGVGFLNKWTNQIQGPRTRTMV